MSEMNLKDKANVLDKINLSGSAAPKKTKIIFKNHDTGEVLGEYENKVVITGSALNANKVFGAEIPFTIPTYNSDMELDNSADPIEEPTAPKLVQLFCVGDSGCGNIPSEVFTTDYRERIAPTPIDPIDPSDFSPEMIMPFRYVDIDNDINDDLRNYYFGRKTFDSLEKIGYYFKKFDTEPQMHLIYADGTELRDDFYSDNNEQIAECFVETRLRITRLDFRDYFENALGWDNSRISSLSLCYAWEKEVDGYIYYQDITPYTVLKFPYQWLTDINTAIDILYQVYY